MGIVDGRLFNRLARFYPSLVTIQQYTEAADSYNELIKSWSNLSGHVDLSGQVSAAGGTERKTPVQVWSVATHVIELAGYYPGIVTKMRAQVGGGNYDVLLVEHDSLSKSTKLVCEVVK